MAGRIIEADRSIIPAMDMDWRETGRVIEQTADVAGVSAYKFGFGVGLSALGLPRAVAMVKERTDKKAIYDHQKAGNDIPDTGTVFARTMREADVDAAIVFPFTGPAVEDAWIKALQDEGVGVIVGAEMTHPQIRQSEGGYVADDAFLRMIDQAAELGVTDFVLPGNKPDKVTMYRQFLDDRLGPGMFDVYSPGLITQGGNLSEGGMAAGPRFHGIIGRAIFDAEDIHAAALSFTSEIRV